MRRLRPWSAFLLACIFMLMPPYVLAQYPADALPDTMTVATSSGILSPAGELILCTKGKVSAPNAPRMLARLLHAGVPHQPDCRLYMRLRILYCLKQMAWQPMRMTHRIMPVGIHAPPVAA